MKDVGKEGMEERLYQNSRCMKKASGNLLLYKVTVKYNYPKKLVPCMCE